MPIISPPTFNLIGPGRLGQTLTRLWHDAGLITVSGLLGREPAHTRSAREFIGAGRVLNWAALAPAQLTLLATPDDAFEPLARTLAASGLIRRGDVVFHCSGALPSAVLAPLRTEGAMIASVHPLKSFAVPELAITNFAGTCCATEGDAAALAMLAPLFDAIGGQRFAIDPTRKLLYHAGAVLACNHLVALMEAALRCMEQAGIPRANAWPALRPLIDGSLANIDQLGPRDALTGPVARGDRVTVLREIAATQQAGPLVSDTYRVLSEMAERLMADRPAALS